MKTKHAANFTIQNFFFVLSPKTEDVNIMLADLTNSYQLNDSVRDRQGYSFILNSRTIWSYLSRMKKKKQRIIRTQKQEGYIVLMPSKKVLMSNRYNWKAQHKSFLCHKH